MSRTGGVYIAVLGTSLIAAVLGLASLTVMRIQNRMLSAAGDVRQAQLNAQAAIQLGLLEMRQNPNWRTTYADLDTAWFTRETKAGTCSLQVLPADPAKDADATTRRAKNDILFADLSTAVKLIGLGQQNQAEQLAELVITPQTEPLDVLRAADAAAKTGSPLAGQSAALDWDAMVAEYQSQGTQISYTSLPATTTPWNFVRNPGIETALVANDPNWSGTAPGLTATALVSEFSTWDHSGSRSLRVSSRNSWQAGAVQHIEHFVKPGQQYDVEAWASLNTGGLLSSGSRAFRITLYVKGTNDPSALVATGPSASASWLYVLFLGLSVTDAHIAGPVTAPTWSGDLEYAFIKIADASSSGGTDEFYVDDLSMREVSSGRYIYRDVLSPSVNTLYSGAPTSAAEGKSHGVYWMDCQGGNLIIERSRILGTLFVLNPGPGSRIDYGPINMTPAKLSYPALVVRGDFAIRATRRGLSEHENQVNYNPPGTPYDFGTLAVLSEDSEANDIYPSVINGPVAVSGNLTIANTMLVRGPVIVGGAVTNAAALVVDHDPASLLNPPPGFDAETYPTRPSSVAKVVRP
jgi:Carbohydrate binding domain